MSVESFVKALKTNLKTSILKDSLTELRVTVSTIRIESHDREQEFMVGAGTGDVSYCVVSTSVTDGPAETCFRESLHPSRSSQSRQ